MAQATHVHVAVKTAEHAWRRKLQRAVRARTAVVDAAVQTDDHRMPDGLLEEAAGPSLKSQSTTARRCRRAFGAVGASTPLVSAPSASIAAARG